jgi:hypothetical protein
MNLCLSLKKVSPQTAMNLLPSLKKARRNEFSLPLKKGKGKVKGLTLRTPKKGRA